MHNRLHISLVQCLSGYHVITYCTLIIFKEKLHISNTHLYLNMRENKVSLLQILIIAYLVFPVPSQKIFGYMCWKYIGQQFPVVCLQMFHVFLFLQRLQFPQEIQARSGLCLVPMHHEGAHKQQQEDRKRVFGWDTTTIRAGEWK